MPYTKLLVLINQNKSIDSQNMCNHKSPINIFQILSVLVMPFFGCYRYERVDL